MSNKCKTCGHRYFSVRHACDKEQKKENLKNPLLVL